MDLPGNFLASNIFKKSMKNMTWISLGHFLNSDTTFTVSIGDKWGKQGAESTQPAKSVRSRKNYALNFAVFVFVCENHDPNFSVLAKI